MLTSQKTKQREILDACCEYITDNGNQETFRKILIDFLQLGTDTKTYQWLAGQLQIDQSSIIRFTQEGYNVDHVLRKKIVKTIQDELFYLLKFDLIKMELFR